MYEIALTICHLEEFQKSNKLSFGTITVETALKLAKLKGGGERETLRFYSKRISCSCLKERYSAVKALQAKTGTCSYCQKTVERSALMVCSRCNFFDYCSRDCQEKAWPGHRTVCDYFNNRDGYAVCTFYDPKKDPRQPKDA